MSTDGVYVKIASYSDDMSVSGCEPRGAEFEPYGEGRHWSNSLVMPVGVYAGGPSAVREFKAAQRRQWDAEREADERRRYEELRKKFEVGG